MEPLLYLVHRIPYPPNKGDKIRSFHLMKFLSTRYRLHLGAFVDDPDDWRHAAALEQYCQTVFLRPKPGMKAAPRLGLGLLRGEPLTLPYYHDAAMARWVRQTMVGQAVRHAMVYSSAMAQYLRGAEFDALYRVIDFVDVDSDKWRQYARHKPFPVSWVYRREARRLRHYEEQVAADFDLSLFVSPREADYFRRDSAVKAEKISFYNNGVDLAYFSPGDDYENPYAPGEQPVVFTGAMDYWANVDAVQWFAQEVFGKVRSTVPAARFYIVGSNPSPQVLALARLSGVTVTGKVPDVRPYLAHAAASVAPLRIARGVQNKVLESMAMGLPVIVTSAAAEGIDAVPDRDFLLADEAEHMAARLTEVLLRGGHACGRAARACVERHYDWERNLQPLAERLARGHGDS